MSVNFILMVFGEFINDCLGFYNFNRRMADKQLLEIKLGVHPVRY